MSTSTQSSAELRPKILAALREAGEPMATSALLDALYLNKEDRRRLHRVLHELRREGLIERLRGNRYQAIAQGERPQRKGAPRYRGIFNANPRGFGFFSPEGPANEEAQIPPLREDVFIPPPAHGGALHGDTVEAEIFRVSKGRLEGRVVAVLRRARTRISGTLRRAGRTGFFVEPDDVRLPGPVFLEQKGERDPLGGAKPGQSVIVELTRFPTPSEQTLAGEIIAAFEDDSDPTVEVERLILLHGLPHEFPEEALAEAEQVAREVRAEDFPERLDLRTLPLVTIDGADARDFDDAVAIEPLEGGGHRLTVAIADVSHYVRPKKALDREAYERGTSVYFPDRVIPMLPHTLSNGICSLNPGEERLCLAAILDIDPTGKVIGSRFEEAVMRSHARLTYEAVAEVLEDRPGWEERHPTLVPFADDLRRMNRVAALLRDQRVRRGSLDFDLPEAHVIMSEDNKRVLDVTRRERTDAHRLIEDFMLAANEAVALLFTRTSTRAPYRIHEAPDMEKLEEFSKVATSLGHPLHLGEEVKPKQIASFMEEISGRPAAYTLHQLLLRSLKQARYDVLNIGHFGLAAKDYLHFTSPIRRYPDLVVHRILKLYLAQARGDAKETRPPHFAPVRDLAEVAAHTSACERRAMQAERDVIDMWRAYYLSERVGEEFEGSISGVASFGLFVSLDAPFVDGLIRIESLSDDHYLLHEDGSHLVGRRSGKLFTLGDRVRVKVVHVSWRERRVDFALLDHHPLLLPRPSQEEPDDAASKPARTREKKANGKAQKAGSPTKKAQKSPANGKTRKSASRRGKRRASEKE